MPKFSGLFDSFDNLDQLNLEDVAFWLKRPPQMTQLENYIANRILYPQTLPLSAADMEIELAILREVIKQTFSQMDKNSNLLGENPFLNPTLRKILIPRRFLKYVPDLVKLTWAFVDIIPVKDKKEDPFTDLWIIVLTDDTDEVIGSLLLPQFSNSSAQLELNILGKAYKVVAGSLVVLPCPKERCQISYKFNQGKILGKAENSLEIFGGKLGIMIDGRKK